MRFAAVAVLSAGLVAFGASSAFAAYPPEPAGNSTSTASTVEAGQPVTFAFGTTTPFYPGSTVTVSSSCVAGDGSTFDGPGTLTTADGVGVAAVTLSFTTPGTCTVTGTGTGPSGAVSGTSTITVTGAGTPAGTTAEAVTANSTADGGTAQSAANSADTGSLAQTGGSNLATIALIGAVGVAGGASLLAVSRRRNTNR